MSKNQNTNVTPADVAAMAKGENLVTDETVTEVKPTIPAQSEKVSETVDASDAEETTTEKVTLKQRLASLTEKLKANKKAVVAGAVATAALTAAIVKFAQQSKADETPEPEGDDVDGDTAQSV